MPELYKTIAELPACQPVASKMRYFLGHQHCNIVYEGNVGFMVGGVGMSDHNCGGDLGLPVVDTRNGLFKVYYFPLMGAAPRDAYDNYAAVKSCFEQNGVTVRERGREKQTFITCVRTILHLPLLAPPSTAAFPSTSSASGSSTPLTT